MITILRPEARERSRPSGRAKADMHAGEASIEELAPAAQPLPSPNACQFSAPPRRKPGLSLGVGGSARARTHRTHRTHCRQSCTVRCWTCTRPPARPPAALRRLCRTPQPPPAGPLPVHGGSDGGGGRRATAALQASPALQPWADRAGECHGRGSAARRPGERRSRAELCSVQGDAAGRGGAAACRRPARGVRCSGAATSTGPACLPARGLCSSKGLPSACMRPPACLPGCLPATARSRSRAAAAAPRAGRNQSASRTRTPGAAIARPRARPAPHTPLGREHGRTAVWLTARAPRDRRDYIDRTARVPRPIAAGAAAPQTLLAQLDLSKAPCSRSSRAAWRTRAGARPRSSSASMCKWCSWRTCPARSRTAGWYGRGAPRCR